MDTYMSLLRSYQGRDKVLRTLGYTTVFLSGTVKGNAQKNLLIMAGEFSHTRLVLRLFDDIPMLRITLATLYGKEPDKWKKVLTLCGQISILFFFPCEKIAWLADTKIISWQSYYFSKAGVACWALSLVFNLLKNIKTIVSVRKRRAHLIKMKQLEGPPSTDASMSSDIRLTKSQELEEYIVLIKNAADFVMAINFLPPGFLWSDKIPAPTNAIFGIISSLLGTMIFLKDNSAKKKS